MEAHEGEHHEEDRDPQDRPGSYGERVIQELTTRLYLRNRAHAVAHAVRNGWI
jgi:hypothetical protein